MTTDARHRHLARDPVMRRLIKRHGPCGIDARRWSPYEALTRAIAHQQLNGRAAQTILGRFVALFGDGRFPTPAQVLATHPARLRGAGFSRAKVRAIKDIARHALAGTVPTRRAAAALADDAIVERLLPIRGVGPLDRRDAADLHARAPGRAAGRRLRRARGLPPRLRQAARPTPKALRALGEQWKPYRSAAAWYLWRAASEPRPVVKKK